jgi:hypothetical protein
VFQGQKHDARGFVPAGRGTDMSTRNGWRGAEETVSCIACGTEVPQAEAREYDKHGNRFDRDGKEFEFLCKPCDAEYCHQPRDGLEATLVRAGAGRTDDDTFLRQYLELVERE